MKSWQAQSIGIFTDPSKIRKNAVILYFITLTSVLIRAIMTSVIVVRFFWDGFPVDLLIPYILADFQGYIGAAVFAVNFFALVSALCIRFENLRTCLR